MLPCCEDGGLSCLPFTNEAIELETKKDLLVVNVCVIKKQCWRNGSPVKSTH